MNNSEMENIKRMLHSNVEDDVLLAFRLLGEYPLGDVKAFFGNKEMITNQYVDNVYWDYRIIILGNKSSFFITTTSIHIFSTSAVKNYLQLSNYTIFDFRTQ